MAGIRGFAPARGFKTIPSTVSGKYKTGEAIVIGSLLVLDSNGELTVCGADPTAVRGVALEAAGSKLNYGEPYSAQTTGIVAGRVQEVSFAEADRSTMFSAQLEDGSSNIVVPLQTHIGESYGVAKRANGSWFVDTSETSAKVVEIVDIVEAQGIQLGFVIVKFLEAVIAAA